jgi:mono/diheme cytochrome c family protein
MTGRLELSRILWLLFAIAPGVALHVHQQWAAGASPGDPQPVHAITLPRFQANLPDAPGREAFAAACLSCHSTTYITMQPPLTAPKWEEVVVKMTKVYAAPIAPEQVPQIVQYVMATKEAGKGELLDTLAVSPAVEPRSIELSRDPEQQAADAKRGKSLYAKNCASCHGEGGAGDGPSAASQLPRPTDLTSHRLSTDALVAAIVRGVPATAMPGFPNLSDDELRATASYSRGLFKAAADEATLLPSGRRAEAEKIYAQNCVACHGARGAGDGPLAATAPRPPANFQLIQPTRAVAAKFIADGVPATTMPPWKHKLDDAQRDALADYVTSLYVEK